MSPQLAAATSCTFEQYTTAFEVGTGLRVALAPGEYEITGREQRDATTYLLLNGQYRVDASLTSSLG